ASHDVVPAQAAMFEDMPHNLEPPHILGMTTVLVHSSYIDHPIQLKIRQWTEPPEHVHHMTDNLAGFLAGLRRADGPGSTGDVRSAASTPSRARESGRARRMVPLSGAAWMGPRRRRASEPAAPWSRRIRWIGHHP